MQVIYWRFSAKTIMNARYLNCSAILSLTEILSDDRKGIFMASASFMFKTHIFEEIRMSKTGFEAINEKLTFVENKSF